MNVEGLMSGLLMSGLLKGVGLLLVGVLKVDLWNELFIED